MYTEIDNFYVLCTTRDYRVIDLISDYTIPVKYKKRIKELKEANPKIDQVAFDILEEDYRHTICTTFLQFTRKEVCYLVKKQLFRLNLILVATLTLTLFSFIKLIQNAPLLRSKSPIPLRSLCKAALLFAGIVGGGLFSAVNYYFIIRVFRQALHTSKEVSAYFVFGIVSDPSDPLYDLFQTTFLSAIKQKYRESRADVTNRLPRVVFFPNRNILTIL